MQFLMRYNGEVSEPLVGRQGSRVSMLVARGSASLLLSQLLSWGSVICTRAHRILGNTYLHLLIYYVIKDVMKEADDQPDKERWGEVWRVLSTEACIPRELGKEGKQESSQRQ